jgi:hypothetical protein
MHGDRGSDGHRGGMRSNKSIPMPTMLQPMTKGEIVGQLVSIDVNKQWLPLMSTKVTGVFEKSPNWSPYGVALIMALT